MNDGKWQLCGRNEALFHEKVTPNHFGTKESASLYVPVKLLNSSLIISNQMNTVIEILPDALRSLFSFHNESVF